MATVFNICKVLIAKCRTEGLQEKMDVYLANNRLTTEEYSELCSMLSNSNGGGKADE